MRLSNLNTCCQVMPHKHNNLFNEGIIDLAGAIELRNDKPQLEIMDTYRNVFYCSRTVDIYLNNLLTDELPFFIENTAPFVLVLLTIADLTQYCTVRQ